MKRALCLLREQPVYRRAAFCAGLAASGYALQNAIPRPEPGDVLVIWNRYGIYHEQANRFEAAGARVLVVENGYLGNSWLGGSWYAVALGHHAGVGTWVEGGPDRWDALGVGLGPWRGDGGETVILGQRGIGEPGVRSPDRWAELTQARIGGRIRVHPGNRAPVLPLKDDLKNAGCVVTWASAAALSALMMGVPVWYAMPGWIGAGASRPVAEFGAEPNRDDAARLAMFRRLVWAMWRLDEVESGAAFDHLLGS